MRAIAVAGLLICIIGVLLVPGGIALAADADAPPEPLSFWSAVESEIQHLVVRGELPFEARTFRPVDRGELAAWLDRRSCRGSESLGTTGGPSRRRLEELFHWDRQQWLNPSPDAQSPQKRPGTLLHFRDGDRLLLIAPYLRLMPTIQTGRKPSWSDSSRLGIRGIFYAGTSVVVSTGFYAAEVLESAGFADPLVAGTDLILHADEATLSARLGALRLRLGRDRHHWGPGLSGTLLLSETAEPFNFVEYQLRLGDRFRFLALTGITNRHAARIGEQGNPARNRYLSAHRLMWNVRPNLSLSLSEGARYQAGSPHVLYLSGIMPYTLVERLDQQDEPSDSHEDYLRNNVLWSLDLSWRFQPHAVLHAEILADDIATETADMPTRGGFQLGCAYAPRWRGWDWTLDVEYTRVSNYTYSVYYQDLCQCDWEHQGQSVGYAAGPDVEEFLVRGAISPALCWSGKVWFRLRRKGAGEIGRPWKPESAACDPAGDPDCGEAAAWTLSGAVTRRTSSGLEIRYRSSTLLWCGGSIEWIQLHGDGKPEQETDVQLQLFLSAGL